MGHFSQNRTLSATTSACLIAFERMRRTSAITSLAPRTAAQSPALYALVAARLGNGKLAQAYFHQPAEIDLANMGNAAGSVR